MRSIVSWDGNDGAAYIADPDYSASHPKDLDKVKRISIYRAGSVCDDLKTSCNASLMFSFFVHLWFVVHQKYVLSCPSKKHYNDIPNPSLHRVRSLLLQLDNLNSSCGP